MVENTDKTKINPNTNEPYTYAFPDNTVLCECGQRINQRELCSCKQRVDVKTTLNLYFEHKQ